MNLGKIPETVLKRSVLKKIRHRRKDVIERAGVGKDTAIIQLEESEIVLSTNPISGTARQISLYGVPSVVNNLVVDGAEPMGLMVSMLLPKDGKEEDIKTIMEGLEKSCELCQMEIITGHTALSDSVNQIVVTLTGIGKRKKVVLEEKQSVKEGYHLVMTKWCALWGTARLIQDYEKELNQRFTADFLEKGTNLSNYTFITKEAIVAKDMGAVAMHDINEGGVFGALWEMASRGNFGFSVDLKKIPIKQETIEICEYFDLNPYRLRGGGSLLVAIENGNKYIDELKGLGIEATLIGKVSKGNDRLICNEEEEQYLEPPKGDACYLVKDRMKEVSERRKRVCEIKY